MNTYEVLQEKACKDGIDVVDYPFNNPKIKGLYYEGTVAIGKHISTHAEKSCVLAEELGHHFTSCGDILNQNDVMNRKQEYRARLYGYNLQIGLTGIVAAYENGCRNQFEIAEFLEVTEEYLVEALKCYRSKYGTFARLDNYVIYFIPALAVMKLI